MPDLFKGSIQNPTPQSYLTKIIEPVLCHLTTEIPYSKSAARLLLGTAIKESLNFKYRKQVGGGPAVGYFQMEPATHDDIWNNYLTFRSDLAKKVTALLTSPGANKHFELEHNDSYAAAMARVHYRRVPAKLPPFDDLSLMAAYWKQYYNTPLGKGVAHQYVTLWNTYVGSRSRLTYLNQCS